MRTQAELVAAIADLCGARFVSVGRTLDMVEAGFSKGDNEVRLHVQCPFRIVRRSTVLLGSTDYLYPLDVRADRSAAFDRYETQFDRSAKLLTERLADGLTVIKADPRDNGAFHLGIAEQLRIEVFPAVSGPVECWRLFVKGSPDHYVYPPSADSS